MRKYLPFFLFGLFVGYWVVKFVEFGFKVGSRTETLLFIEGFK